MYYSRSYLGKNVLFNSVGHSQKCTWSATSDVINGVLWRHYSGISHQLSANSHRLWKKQSFTSL